MFKDDPSILSWKFLTSKPSRQRGPATKPGETLTNTNSVFKTTMLSIKSFLASSTLALNRFTISPSSSQSTRLRFLTTTITRRNSPFQAQTTSPISSSASVEPRKEDVVIVGAGIAGLATALSLHRLGIRSLVLEQADSLRTGGVSLTLASNGWTALDVIGVGDEIRPQFLEIQGVVIRAQDGKELRSLKFRDETETESQEIRAIERKVLLQTLASKLPPEAISFSSKLEKIERSQTGETMLELVDGTRLLSKIVIGCDGVKSPVAKWMGFSEAKYAGHIAFRGLGAYPNGQPFEPSVNYVYGRGLRAGCVPISSSKVYWFIIFNEPTPGPRIDDPALLKKEARELVKNFPSEILDAINKTPDDTIVKTPLVDRWLWPIVSPSVFSGGVVLAGDAWHPMTPNLGQGACCALEDAVVLAKKLSGVLDAGPTSINDALKSYETERWARVFSMTVRANLVGAFLQWGNPLVCAVRNNLIFPKLVKLGPMFKHAKFSCEPLK